MRAVFAFFFFCLSSAASAETQTLLGWHESGQLAYLSVQTEPGKPATIRICRSSGDDLPAAWPTAVAVGPGVLCADFPDPADGPKAVDIAKTGAQKPLKAAPWGLKATLAVDGTKHTVTISDGPEKKKSLPVVESAEPLKLGEVLWRK